MSILRMSAAEYQQKQMKRSGNKFHAVKKQVDGITFDSTHEAERYQLLKLEQKAGTIRNLQVHVPIHVCIAGEHVFDYEADFQFERKEIISGKECWFEITEDAKGCKKGAAYRLFRLKAKVIRAALGIEIEEV